MSNAWIPGFGSRAPGPQGPGRAWLLCFWALLRSDAPVRAGPKCQQALKKKMARVLCLSTWGADPKCQQAFKKKMARVLCFSSKEDWP